MILVCVGASEFPFDRLLEMVDKLCDDGYISGEDLVVQSGCSDYKPRNYKAFSIIDREEFQKYSDDADLIITHAGTGSVLPPLKKGKKIIVVPRDSSKNEHIDDHQFELSKIFSQAGYTLEAKSYEELSTYIKNMDEFIPKVFASNTEKFNDLVLSYIDNF